MRASLFERLALELRSLLAVLGQLPVPAEVTRTLGATLEYMLCDAFRSHEQTSRYWVDGVIIQRIELEQGRLVAEAVTWCADGQAQWEVPAEIRADVSELPTFKIGLVRVSIGDAALADLGAHRGANARKASRPTEWLLGLALQPAPRGGC